MLQRVFDEWNEIAAFVQSKGNAVHHFTDEAWLGNLSFLTDIISHLNDLNKKLQGKDNLIHELFDALKVSEVKLDLWINHFKKKCYHALSTFVVLPNFKHGQMNVCPEEEPTSRFHNFTRASKIL